MMSDWMYLSIEVNGNERDVHECLTELTFQDRSSLPGEPHWFFYSEITGQLDFGDDEFSLTSGSRKREISASHSLDMIWKHLTTKHSVEIKVKTYDYWETGNANIFRQGEIVAFWKVDKNGNPDTPPIENNSKREGF